MNPEEYERMYRVEDTFWWYLGMRQIYATVLTGWLQGHTGRRVLDAGCGTGGNFLFTMQYGQAFGVDLADQAIAFCRSRGLGDRVCQARLEALPFAAATFDLVTSFDVMYTIEDDLAAFAEVARVTKPGGLALVSLPAFEFLRSEHDVAIHTRRRYTNAEVRQMMELVGFRVERLTYANTLLFLPAAAIRLAKRWRPGHLIRPRSDLDPLPPWLNALLAAVLAWEGKLIRWLDLPFGLTVICVGRREPIHPALNLSFDQRAVAKASGQRER
ncbi:MAG: class I SAM-dependent methyltransferase [Chloroflexi bacterium]|nr:class I SAM-dependent methyltransferase [Chloroflexota bacterium]